MRQSLINIYKQTGNTVDGRWLQDCIGTLEEARARADATESVNGNRISVAVVDALNSLTPDYEYHTGLTRLA